MAKQTQSESRLSLNRRQLLAAAAANQATGIAPNANTVAVTNSAQAASVAKASVSETPALECLRVYGSEN